MVPVHRILLVAAVVSTLACPDFPAQQTTADCGLNGCTSTSTGTSTGTSTDTEGSLTLPTTAGGPTATSTDIPMTIGPEITSTSAAPDLPAFDPPPWIADLAVKPGAAAEIGPSIVTYTASDDVVQAELFDDGELVATGIAGEAFIFPVSSAPHNNPGSWLRVVVHDAANQTAYDEVYQPSAVKAPGSEVWTTIEADSGKSSGGGGVALHGDDVVSAGFQLIDAQARMTVRRYDQAGKWSASEQGWSHDHPGWTESPTLAGSSITGSAVAVDPAGNIVAIGNVADGADTRMYLVRFDAKGNYDWEVLGNLGTEARGVAVTADGTAYVAGAIRTGKNPDRWDLAVWVYGPDKVAYGVDVYADPEDKLQQRSERGRAVAVLGSGRVAVAGTREVLAQDWAEPQTRGVMLLYEGKGKRVGAVWSSPGEVQGIDAVLAAVATADGVALCGYAIDPADPQQKPQILLRWLREDLSEVRKPHLEKTLGAARCTALGYTIEHKLIVGANVQDGDEGDNIWIYAVDEPPITYLKYNGPADAADRIFGMDCEYMCAWTGYQGTALGGQWLTGLLRG